MARVFSNIRSFYETLFPTAAGIGSLSECNELSEQALFRVASLRGFYTECWGVLKSTLPTFFSFWL